MKPLHAMNHVRIPFIRDGLISTGLIGTEKINKPDVLKGMKILDIGCGAGILSEALGRLKADVTGIDPSEGLLDTAKSHLKGHFSNIEYICSTIEEHSINNQEKYDAVVASEVLEHVPDQRAFLHECVKCLKVGGSIFITTINKTQASWLGAIVAAENILNLVPKNTHEWNQFISPTDVTKILNEVNCSTILVHGIRYEFWRDIAVFQKFDGINYALQAVKNAN